MALIIEYLPSIVITLANFITPLLFSVIINYEDYSPAFEIRFTLMRYNGPEPDLKMNSIRNAVRTYS